MRSDPLSPGRWAPRKVIAEFRVPRAYSLDPWRPACILCVLILVSVNIYYFPLCSWKEILQV